MPAEAMTASQASLAPVCRPDTEERGEVSEVFVSEIAALHAASFGWSLHCCHRNQEEAEEVLQQTYLKILEGKARFDGRSSLKTWLFAVIRKTAKEHRRKGLGRALNLIRWVRERESRDGQLRETTDIVRTERTRVLTRALGDISKRQRETLHLVFYQECTIEEAAAVLGISVGSARTHYERGKRRLRKVLTREVGNGTI